MSIFNKMTPQQCSKLNLKELASKHHNRTLRWNGRLYRGGRMYLDGWECILSIQQMQEFKNYLWEPVKQKVEKLKGDLAKNSLFLNHFEDTSKDGGSSWVILTTSKKPNLNRGDSSLKNLNVFQTFQSAYYRMWEYGVEEALKKCHGQMTIK